jgi:hypothetical protein
MVPCLDAEGKFYELKTEESCRPIDYADAVATDIVKKLNWEHLFAWPGFASPGSAAQSLQAYCKMYANRDFGFVQERKEKALASLYGFLIQPAPWEKISDEDLEVFRALSETQSDALNLACSKLTLNKRKRREEAKADAFLASLGKDKETASERGRPPPLRSHELTWLPINLRGRTTYPNPNPTSPQYERPAYAPPSPGEGAQPAFAAPSQPAPPPSSP